jgi:hypothetical protein
MGKKDASVKTGLGVDNIMGKGGSGAFYTVPRACNHHAVVEGGGLALLASIGRWSRRSGRWQRTTSAEMNGADER